MFKKAVIILSLLIICSSCSTNNSSGNITPAPSPTINPSVQLSNKPSDKPTVEPTEQSNPLREQIANMTLDEKIGQMVIVGLDGTSMKQRDKEMIETYRVGGFILYKDNMRDADQILSLLNQLKEENQENQIPLWLSLDQEGGKVNRMPAEFTKFPPAAEVGKVDNIDYTKQIGEAIGEAVSALGFNMDFAPVLDINSNPKNPIIGNRSYGIDAESVITHGLETMKALQSNQVAAVVKHFPGHGDTSVDSHLDLPVVNKSLAELKAFELLPFVEAIKQNTDAIMIAHLLIPKIDKTYPASLSKILISNLLREDLGYDGVVITDDMTMGGITDHFKVGEAAVTSVQAGSDLILIGHEYDKQVSVIKALKKAAREGVISSEMLDKSVYRILQLKEKYKLEDKALPAINVKAVNVQIKAALDAK